MADGGATPEHGSVSRDREILCAVLHATSNAKPGQKNIKGRETLQDGWKCKDGWESCKPIGEWHGVTTNAEGRVIGLDLDHNDLAGIIPPQLGDLDALEELHLRLNMLQGGIPREIGRLRSLTKLDLSYNLLGGAIPPELGDLDALQELHLRSNKFEGGIPKGLGKLRALNRIDLSYNPLGGVIPPELGDLDALDDLAIIDSKIQGNIPSELGKLRTLKSLALSDNYLDGSIPAELGNLGALKSMQLENNQLVGTIPPELGNLGALLFIRLRNNQLGGLWDHTQDASLGQEAPSVSDGAVPSQLRRLLAVLRGAEETRFFFLDANPWAEPPEAVVNSGMPAVIAYFEDLYSSPCGVRRNSVKVVIVGQEGAGKTSLCRSMKTGRATPTSGSTESTVYADVYSMELNGVGVRMCDCAGQVAYTGLLQMFLTPRAVCLVVCDAGAFGQQGFEADDQIEKDIRNLEKLRVCDWLRSISYRVPESDAFLVATKCDLARGNASGTAQRMDLACRMWLASWADDGMKPIRLEDGVCLTSCCPPASEEVVESTPTNANIFQRGEAAVGKLLSSFLFGKDLGTSGNLTRGLDWECDWLDDKAVEPRPSMLRRVVNKRDGIGHRGAEMMLPCSWDIALTVLEALENGRDPVEAVVQRSTKTDGVVESKTDPFRGITVEELNVRWKAVVDELSKKEINVTNPDHALEGALCIREFDGTVVRHETFVFLDVVWLSRILKPLLNHKDSESNDGKVFLGDTGDTRITLADNRHIVSWNRLKEDGILEPELARILWPDLFKYVLPTLASLGLTFPLGHDPAEGEVVLLRLGRDRPKSVGDDIDEFRLRYSAVLGVRWKYFLGVPPGAIEKVLARCCSIGGVQTFWRFGVLVQGAISGSEGAGSFALVLEYSSDSNQLDMKVYGDICTVAPWAVLAYAISAVRTMAMEFPGLPSRAFLQCPQHREDMLITSMVPSFWRIEGADDAVPRLEEWGRWLLNLSAWWTSEKPEESRDLHYGNLLSEQSKAAREMFITDMKEDLGIVLRSAAASGQDGQYQNWKNLDLKLDNIQRRLDGDKLDVLVDLEATKGGLEATLAKMMDLLAARDGVMGRLDFLVAMLMTVRGDKVDTPRHACILPGDYAEPHGLSDELRRPEVWKKKVEEWRESDFKAGKGVWKKKMRLFLVCAHTRQLVPCGHNGRGYDIQRVRKWVRMAVDLAKFALQVTCASLAAVTVTQLPASTLGGVGEQAAEAAFASLPGMLGGLTLRADDDEAAEALRGEPQALEGNAYQSLRRFVHEMEDTSRVEISAATKKTHKERRAPPSTSDFVYFDQVMVKVQPRNGDGEAQWVLSDFEEAWHDATRKAEMG